MIHPTRSLQLQAPRPRSRNSRWSNSAGQQTGIDTEDHDRATPHRPLPRTNREDPNPDRRPFMSAQEEAPRVGYDLTKSSCKVQPERRATLIRFSPRTHDALLRKHPDIAMARSSFAEARGAVLFSIRQQRNSGNRARPAIIQFRRKLTVNGIQTRTPILDLGTIKVQLTPHAERRLRPARGSRPKA